ncbi:MAG: DNA repair protein RadA, partial [Tissierellia bacterium]|nr:DNA repair protein RadA [Tissierellia bacterium]
MKQKIIYRCSECGNESLRWMGKCSECNSWNTFVETSISTKKNRKDRGQSTGATGRVPIKLLDVDTEDDQRMVTGIDEFNRVLGGGIVRDSVTIVTARPGAGKSTLLLEIANDIAEQGHRVLYVSGEESESQISSRAYRILDRIPKDIWILSDNSMDNVLNVIDKVNPELIVIDSIQTFTLGEFDSRAGSPVQSVECANALVDIAKNKDRPRAVIMVGHMTKANEIAGLRTLEHLVDTVIYLEGESG